MDLTTLEFTLLDTPYREGTTNGTHAFLTTRAGDRLEIIDLETLQRTIVTVDTGATNQVIYSDNYIYFLSLLRAVIYSTTQHSIIEYRYQPSRTQSQTSVVINGHIYRFGSGYTIINPFLNYEIMHNQRQSLQVIYTVITTNGVVVFNLVNEQDFFIFNTSHALQPLTTVSTAVTFAARDTLFFLREPNITTYDFNTNTLTVHPFLSEIPYVPNSALTEHKLVFVVSANGGLAAYLYDFTSRSIERVLVPGVLANQMLSSRDFVAIKQKTSGASTHAIHLINVNTYSLMTVQLGTVEYALFRDNIFAVLTRNNVLLIDVAENIVLREFSISATDQWGNIFVAGDTVFLTKYAPTDVIYVMDLQRNFTMTRLTTPMRDIQFTVVGNYAVFSGTVSLQTQPVEVFDLVNLSWSIITLPRSLYTDKVILLAVGSQVLVGRSLTIELVDLTTGAFTTLPFPVAELNSIAIIGSKLIVRSRAPAQAAVTMTIYEVTTGDWTSILFPRGIATDFAASNYVLVNIGSISSSRPFIMPVATLLEGFDNRELFIGQSTSLELSVAGPLLRYQWTHGDRHLQRSDAVLTLENVTMQSNGRYRVDIFDHCNFHMVHEANLTVHDVPRFDLPLTDSVVLCDRIENLTISAGGVAVEYKWTIEGDAIPNEFEPVLHLSPSDMPCNTRALVCAYATNPSGQSQSCAGVKMVELDSVILGPLPTTRSSTWFSETVVELSVEIMEEDCTSHVWYIDGARGAQVEAQHSTMSVELSPSMARSEFWVRVKCGNSRIESRRFSFEQVSALPVYGVALIVVSLFIGVAVFVVVIVLQRKRLSQSQDKEVELSALLSNAKTDSLMKESMPIINKTTWQWTPTDDFSYKSLESLPIEVDTSQLKFVEKGEPLEVEMNFNKELHLSSRSQQKRTKKSTVLTEKLISGTKVDIYAPTSPKYEVIVEPETLYIESGESHSVTVSVRMRMTTRCKVVLIVVLEQQKIYSAIEFKLESKMSTWIDLEEVQMSGEFLGGGGFGSVVLGVYRGQDVAVKKLLSQYLTDDMKIEFEREVTLMKSLRHPNIVQFVGASNVKESLAIVIEYAPLGSLASVMEKQQLSTQLKVMCLLETAKALQFLHSNGVIHRDIKPQNILVFSLENKSPVHVKLTDFGTSRFIADDPTTITKNVGTIAFMAPEALGRSPRIDKSADVYSFAVLMWSVLFEQTPFNDFKWDSDIEQHVKSGNRLPFPHGHDVEPSLVKLIEECWQHEPSTRPSINIVVQRLANIKS
eukprot:TRINITY_DN1415_c0_g1_i5.p1 TRINITY_DN1415_c0_g1~~TRINITY_DN1415_c0_g1_i5.p1  ORF type:complete len:1337 (-),score=239.97 TRINITY_DN1415_c0_g1_i5:38-3829(-)